MNADLHSICFNFITNAHQQLAISLNNKLKPFYSLMTPWHWTLEREGPDEKLLICLFPSDSIWWSCGWSKQLSIYWYQFGWRVRGLILSTVACWMMWRGDRHTAVTLVLSFISVTFIIPLQIVPCNSRLKTFADLCLHTFWQWTSSTWARLRDGTCSWFLRWGQRMVGNIIAAAATHGAPRITEKTVSGDGWGNTVFQSRDKVSLPVRLWWQITLPARVVSHVIGWQTG